MFLDSLKPVEAKVGYGALGLGGELGYEGKAVSVGRRAYEHALSTHPPARLVFELGGRFEWFRAEVALNDDVPRGASHADFVVAADRRPAGGARRLRRSPRRGGRAAARSRSVRRGREPPRTVRQHGPLAPQPRRLARP